MEYRVVYSDELYHYGILGMKWGVRRYQNEDGTLTEAGKKHYQGRIDSYARKIDSKSNKIYKLTKSEKAVKQQRNRSIKRAKAKYVYDKNIGDASRGRDLALIGKTPTGHQTRAMEKVNEASEKLAALDRKEEKINEKVARAEKQQTKYAKRAQKVWDSVAEVSMKDASKLDLSKAEEILKQYSRS